MSIGAELGQYILQTNNSKKFWRSNGGFEPPSLLLGTPVVCNQNDNT